MVPTDMSTGLMTSTVHRHDKESSLWDSEWLEWHSCTTHSYLSPFCLHSFCGPTSDPRSEKILKYDTGHQYEILVIGEEAHLGYNRVGLTQYFEHRKIEQLYLNPPEWVSNYLSTFSVPLLPIRTEEAL